MRMKGIGGSGGKFVGILRFTKSLRECGRRGLGILMLLPRSSSRSSGRRATDKNISKMDRTHPKYNQKHAAFVNKKLEQKKTQGNINTPGGSRELDERDVTHIRSPYPKPFI